MTGSARSISLVFSLLASTALVAQGVNGYYRQPATSANSIVFVSEGDLWSVPLSGGAAHRLTTHPGLESSPVFSPDGRSIAFAAEYDGVPDVYVMPEEGGVPQRLTWFGVRSRPAGWTPAGEVLIITDRYATLPDDQMIAVNPKDLSIRRIPLQQVSDGLFGPDGSLYFIRLPFQGSQTKRYKGGTIQQLWKWTPGAAEAFPLTTDYPGTSKNPMLFDGRLYFLSDRDGTMNLWSMDPAGGAPVQHTFHSGWDIQSASAARDVIIYQLGADLWRWTPGAEPGKLEIRISTDLDQRRARWMKDPVDWLSAASLSQDGDQVVLTARGQVFVAPVKSGRFVTAAAPTGVRLRNAAFLGKGGTLVYQSDESGEIEFFTSKADGTGPRTRVSRDGHIYRSRPFPSPDGKWIASFDKAFDLTLHNVASGEAVHVDRNTVDLFSDLTWSADSRYLAYVSAAPNFMQRIKIYDTQARAGLFVTSDRADSYSPAFSRDGKFLWFLSDRNLGTRVGSPWGPRQPEPFLDKPTLVMGIALQGGNRSPFAAPDELHPADKKDSKDGAGEGGKPGGKGSAAAGKALPAIDFDGLLERAFVTPVPPGAYSGLMANDKALFYFDAGIAYGGEADLKAWEISWEATEPVTVLSGADMASLNDTGSHILARKGDTLYVFEAAARAADKEKSAVDLSAWNLRVDSREEWRQMFVESWRLLRDYFYDPAMHGVAWREQLERHLPLVERVSDRTELDDAIKQMVGELSALHTFVYGGDRRRPGRSIDLANLGAEAERDEVAGGWRVTRIHRGDPDRPQEAAPLARPDSRVKEGEVIVAVNGTRALDLPALESALQFQAGHPVLLEVRAADPKATVRRVLVNPIGVWAAASLRYSDWEERTRARVEEKGSGKIGYLHLRAMGGEDWESFVRNYYPVWNRQGLIVDVRHNNGGNIDAWVLEKLLRRAWMYWKGREGDPFPNMHYAFSGHMVALVDEGTSSDGEAFAEGFKRLGLGPVIGTRTWGGEIWLSSSNRLVDNGIASAAEWGVYGPQGDWLVEGHGVEPDMVVDNLPAATFAGGDTQLDAAIAHLLQKIAADPKGIPAPPPFPDKSFRYPSEPN